MATAVPDPLGINTRAEFASALSALRVKAGVTVRFVSQRSGASLGTLSGWFGGQHVPEKASETMLAEVLGVCGVEDQETVASWLEAARRVRPQRRDARGRSEPYRGLEPFRVEDSEWFFGRGDLVRDIGQRVFDLLSSRVSPASPIVVMGASGSGKSSLLSAGLVPHLRAEGVDVSIITPGSDPDRRIRQQAGVDVLIIDQFEELWTECGDSAERARAMYAIGHVDPGRVVVIGLRADFVHRAEREPVLRDALKDSVPVGRLTAEEVRSVILEPARRIDCLIEPDLLQLLLIEFSPTGSRATLNDGALALLSHALQETWHQSTRRRMTVEDYVATGGIAGAVQRTAESVYGALSDDQRERARQVFLRLITIDGTVVLRRRAQYDEVFADDGDKFRDVVECFARRRLLTVERDHVEISHEVLISAWTRLREWVDADRDRIVTHRRPAVASMRWQRTRDAAVLFDSADLDRSRAWQPGGEWESEANHFEREFLAAARAHRDSARVVEPRPDRVRRLVIALIVVTVVAVGLLVAVIDLRLDLDTQRRSTQQAQNESTALGLAADAHDLHSADPALAAQVALAAYRLFPASRTRTVLLDTAAVGTAIRYVGPAAEARIAVTGDGSLAALGFADGSVRLVRLTSQPTLAEVGRFRVDGSVTGLAFEPSASVLAVAAASGIRLWDVTEPDRPIERSVVSVAADGGGDVIGLAVAPDGGELLAAADSGRLVRWDISDLDRPMALSAVPAGSSVAKVRYSPDGRLLVTVTRTGTVRIWPAANPTGPAAFELGDANDAVTAVVFTRDGQSMFLAMRRSGLTRWDVVGSDLRPAPGARALSVDATELAQGADGGPVAMIDPDGASRLWDPQSGRITILPAPASVSLALSPTGVLLGDGDGVVRLWPPGVGDESVPAGAPPEPQRVIDALCASGSSPLTDGEWDRYLPDRPRRDFCADH